MPISNNTTTPTKLKRTYTRLRKSTRNFASLLVRDPVDYLDFEAELTNNLNQVSYAINSFSYRPSQPYLLESPKSKGINRATVVLEIEDSLVYRYCIEEVEDELLDRARRENIRGGVKIKSVRTPEGDSFYEKWFKDWKAHQDSLRRDLEHKQIIVTTDIATFFDSINLFVLKDLVRGDVAANKKKILDLLFYFLEQTTFRFEYEVNRFTGLLQESIDCSRILAYYFLYPLDESIRNFCARYDAIYYRYVDDMNLLVDSEPSGKRGLKVVTESLRKLGLLSSVEKTSILDGAQAKAEMFFEENDKLSEIEDSLVLKLKSAESIQHELGKLEEIYTQYKQRRNRKNWIKVLRRFYTLSAMSGASFLLDDLSDHLTDYPAIMASDKIAKLLIRLEDVDALNRAIETIIAYLYSEENLYPALEASLLETILYFDPEKFSEENKLRIQQCCDDVFFGTNGYSALSDYSRAVTCLLFYKFCRDQLTRLARHYIASSENDWLLRKYLIFVSLTTDNQALRERSLEKSRGEQSRSISRFVNFVENIDKYKRMKRFERFSESVNRIYIYQNKELGFELYEEYRPIRGEILGKILQVYSEQN